MPLDAKILEAYKKRRKKVLAAGGEAKIKKRHDKGLMTARERLMYLFQPDTFQEVGAYIKHHCTSFGMERAGLSRATASLREPASSMDVR